MLLWPIVELLASVLSRPYSPDEVVWVRYGVHLLLMLVLWTPGGPARLGRTCRLAFASHPRAHHAGNAGLLVLAVARLSIDATMSLFWVAPLLAMLLGTFWLRERAGERQWMAAAAAYAGVLVALGLSTSACVGRRSCRC